MTKQEQTKIPHLKADAQITLTLGTGFIGNLQNSLNHLIEGKKADIKTLENKQGKYDNLTPWEGAVITLTTLLQEISKIAEKEGMIEYKNIEDFIPKNLVEDLNQQ